MLENPITYLYFLKYCFILFCFLYLEEFINTSVTIHAVHHTYIYATGYQRILATDVLQLFNNMKFSKHKSVYLIIQKKTAAFVRRP